MAAPATGSSPPTPLGWRVTLPCTTLTRQTCPAAPDGWRNRKRGRGPPGYGHIPPTGRIASSNGSRRCTRRREQTASGRAVTVGAGTCPLGHVAPDAQPTSSCWPDACGGTYYRAWLHDNSAE